MAVNLTTPTKDTVIGRFEQAGENDIFQIVGPGGNIVASMTSKGLLSPTLVPVVQTSLVAINTDEEKTATNVSSATTLYNIALWMESRHDGGPSDTLMASIQYSAPDGDIEEVQLMLHGNIHEIQEENYVFLCEANTSIILTTRFTGSPFHYDIAAGISILPTAG
jgi:hypothetical protein